MRDRLISLGLSRPPRIKHNDFDAPMLTLDDFEIQGLSVDDLSILKDCELLRDSALQTDLATMCIAMAKLCSCINCVMPAYYNLVKEHGLAFRHKDTGHSSLSHFVDKEHQVDKKQLNDIELTDWVQDLPARCLYTTSSAAEAVDVGASFIIHRAVLHMVYLATVSTLNKSQALPSVRMATLRQYHSSQAASSDIASRASRDIANIVLDLVNLKLEKFLPTSTLTLLLPAIMVHLDDLKSSNDVTRMEALQGFCHCVKILDNLGERYPAAEWALHLVEDAVNNAKFDIAIAANASVHGKTQTRKGQSIAQHVSQLLYAGETAGVAEQGPSVSSHYTHNASTTRAETVPVTTEGPNSESDFTNLSGEALDDPLYSYIHGLGEGNSVDTMWSQTALEAFI